MQRFKMTSSGSVSVIQLQSIGYQRLDTTQMRYMTRVLPALLAVLNFSAVAAGNSLYRCTDETGLVLLTSNAAAADICKSMSMAARKCADGSCPVRITKDQGGHLYINGTINDTRVRFPVENDARSSTICIRGQCKMQ